MTRLGKKAPLTSTLLALGALLAVATGPRGAQAVAADPAAAPAPGAGAPAPVVVEMFTSQGCSSCPSADRLLNRLLRDPKLASQIIPLSFHVDYWDHQGWVDPFSSHDWTVRQEGYAQIFHADRIYTPQLVVNGHGQAVGSQEADVRQTIGQALGATDPDTAIVIQDVAVTTPPSRGADGSVRVKVAAHLTKSIPAAGLDLWVGVTENGLVTSVKGGENNTATLHDDHVVRKLVKAFTLSSKPGPDQTAEVVLPLAKGGDLASFSVVAFAQDPKSLIIDGAASHGVGR